MFHVACFLILVKFQLHTHFMSDIYRRRRAPTAQRPLVAHELRVDVEDNALKHRISF